MSSLSSKNNLGRTLIWVEWRRLALLSLDEFILSIISIFKSRMSFVKSYAQEYGQQ